VLVFLSLLLSSLSSTDFNDAKVFDLLIHFFKTMFDEDVLPQLLANKRSDDEYVDTVTKIWV
jgi:hypothetical protein